MSFLILIVILTTSVEAALNTAILPTKVFAKVNYAEINSNTTVKNQWLSGERVI